MRLGYSSPFEDCLARRCVTMKALCSVSVGKGSKGGLRFVRGRC